MLERGLNLSASCHINVFVELKGALTTFKADKWIEDIEILSMINISGWCHTHLVPHYSSCCVC